MSLQPYDYGLWTDDEANPPHTPDHPVHVTFWSADGLADNHRRLGSECHFAARAIARVQAAVMVPCPYQGVALLRMAQLDIRTSERLYRRLAGYPAR